MNAQPGRHQNGVRLLAQVSTLPLLVFVLCAPLSLLDDPAEWEASRWQYVFPFAKVVLIRNYCAKWAIPEFNPALAKAEQRLRVIRVLEERNKRTRPLQLPTEPAASPTTSLASSFTWGLIAPHSASRAWSSPLCSALGHHVVPDVASGDAHAAEHFAVGDAAAQAFEDRLGVEGGAG
jgi:hypothetical protein